ncbi:MAG TPA: protein kinase, partial [Gemmatimonadales bacterium]|nr:protein kinase [Gemmatimonadales bacterium]
MADPVASLASALQDRYRIERQLGQGGMATVYLAQDLRNHRKVALKVLRPDLAALLGAERFLLEIETTANLHHPHILPLFDSGQAGDFLYYAMPFVPGESLRDRLTRENQLPIADAVRIATDVADALDYAHRSGVLHRDIKPENILLHDGRALVADFGVALAMKNAGGTRLTETGLSLGTPQYMSPEQSAAERDLDPRTDVYALGAVTYEMLAGEPPFTGNTTQAIIAKRMMETPRPISVLRKAVPPAVEAAVLRALEKLPADRPASAAAYAAALKETGRTAEVVPLPAKAGLRWRTAALVLSGVALSVFAIRGYLGAKASTATAALPTRVTIPLGQDQLLEQDGLPFDLSADGSEIVYSAASEGKSQLYLRPIGSFQGTPIPGTEGARQPFFSPDGAWIGYVANHRLEKVSRDGGAPLVIAEVPDQWFGAAWGRNGTIYFAEDDTSL